MLIWRRFYEVNETLLRHNGEDSSTYAGAMKEELSTTAALNRPDDRGASSLPQSPREDSLECTQAIGILHFAMEEALF